jgi:hypothetical protein
VIDVDELTTTEENDAILNILTSEGVPFRLYVDFAVRRLNQQLDRAQRLTEGIFYLNSKSIIPVESSSSLRRSW